MVDIVKGPDFLSFAGNPVRCEVHSPEHVVSMGSQAKLKILISDIDTVAGHRFMLHLFGRDLVFTSANVPDGSGLQYERAVPGDSAQVFARKILSAFLSNYDLALSYIISLQDSQITLTARETGSGGDLSFENIDALGIEQSYVQAGQETVLRENFAIVAFLFDSDKKPLFQEIKPVDALGNAVFDFSQYLESILSEMNENRFRWPELTNAYHYRHTNYHYIYYLGFAEKYDGEVRRITWSDPCCAVGGGLDQETLSSLSLLGLSYFTDPNTAMRFMTWAPVEKLTGPSQPEKLFFIFTNDELSKYRAGVVVHFTDGSVYSFFISPLISIVPFYVTELMVGYDLMGLGLIYPSKIVDYWNVKLVDEYGNDLSETRKFILDPEVYEHERTFLFCNSFSAYDLVRFTGRRSLTLEYDRETGEVVSDEVPSPFNAPRRQFASSESQVYEASSGYVDFRTKNYYRDFLLSNEVYEIVDGNLYRIVIRSSSIREYFRDDVLLYWLDFEYERSYRHQRYSDYTPGGQNNGIPMVVEQEPIVERAVNPIMADHLMIDLVPPGYMLECLVFTNISASTGQISAGTFPGAHDVFEQVAVAGQDYTTIRIFKMFSETSATSVFLNHGMEGDAWNGMQLFVRATLRQMT